jgi:hypothetical protein
MEWIDVNVKLPEEGVSVLVFNSNNNRIEIRDLLSKEYKTWMSRVSGFYIKGDISHWMFLPEKPFL